VHSTNKGDKMDKQQKLDAIERKADEIKELKRQLEEPESKFKTGVKVSIIDKSDYLCGDSYFGNDDKALEIKEHSECNTYLVYNHDKSDNFFVNEDKLELYVVEEKTFGNSADTYTVSEDGHLELSDINGNDFEVCSTKELIKACELAIERRKMRKQ